MSAYIAGKCRECGAAYEVEANAWVMAHWHTPGAWPLKVSLPCGHERNGVYHFHFKHR